MPKHDSKPSGPQLRYLCQLAERTGTTFAPPQTRQQASAEIERLRQRSRSPGFERQADREAAEKPR